MIVTERKRHTLIKESVRLVSLHSRPQSTTERAVKVLSIERRLEDCGGEIRQCSRIRLSSGLK
jgi:hypothetical protein